MSSSTDDKLPGKPHANSPQLKTSGTTDEELTRRAVESLLKDAEAWQRREARQYRAIRQRLVTAECNKTYLRNLLNRNKQHNDRIEQSQSRRQEHNRRPQLHPEQAGGSGSRREPRRSRSTRESRERSRSAERTPKRRRTKNGSSSN